jgi:hypothetical protein
MHVVNMRILSQAGPERVLSGFKAIPSDLRNLQTGGMELPDATLEKAEAASTGGFFSFVKKKLVADANPKEGLIRSEPFPDRLP